MDNYIFNSLLLIGGVYGIVFLYVYQAWQKCKINLKSTAVDYFNKNHLILSFSLSVNNQSNKQLFIEDTRLYVYINSIKAAKIFIPYTTVILPNSDNTVLLTTDINWKSDLKDLWQSLITQALTSANVMIAGKVKINGFFVPIPQISVTQINLLDYLKK